MTIQIAAGPEYTGETYIWCDVCAPRFRTQEYEWEGNISGVAALNDDSYATAEDIIRILREAAGVDA